MPFSQVLHSLGAIAAIIAPARRPVRPSRSISTSPNR